MSAPTPAPGDESPREGYYPDPSIPGYVRYWNGASWVPGTSRPAPQQGEAMPVAPAEDAAGPHPPGPAAVDETGPLFFDEEPYDDGSRPEPSTAWQADASRQTGFGGDRDRRVSWGGTGQPAQPEPGPDPRTSAGGSPAAGTPTDHSPAAERTDRTPADPRRPAQADPTGGALPGMRDGGGQVAENTVAIRVARPGRSGGGSRDTGRPPADGTVTIRAVGPAGRTPGPRDAEQPPVEGTMTIRAIGPAADAAQASASAAPATPRASAPAPSPAQQSAPAQDPARLNSPLTPGPGGGSTSWAQQARPEQAARPQPQASAPQQPAFPQQSQPHPGAQEPRRDQPVVPWKPPVDDHFQQLAAAQAAARPAALGKRFAARLIDTVVLGVLVGALAVPLATQAADHINEKIDAAKLSGETVTVWLLDSTTAGLAGVVLGAFLVLGVLLEALPTAKWGRTLGKKLCGLDVRDIESHGPPTFGAALRRWLVYGVLGLLVIGVVDVLWCLIDRPWRQCWHDKAARTFVAG
ncbi:RDD family protein [Streptomyces sp. RKAG290]|uniref:RDD family protein n=1 Tax=Streptomyces sp. RKAG290 TaxID=2888348 RepID=UPI00203384EA|nr:RDD family protein [Streptomyces sp. RKAG290]MCM2413844.1 RDD family protein [Streptomyces sp. RKAG290]